MDIENNFLVYIGTARGALACTTLKKNEAARFDLSKVGNSEITALEWGRTDKEILIGNKNGELLLYNPLLNKYTKTVSDLNGEGPVVGLGVLDEVDKILIGQQDGFINIWSKKDQDYFKINLQSEGTLECMVQNKHVTDIIGTGGEWNDLKLWNIETKEAVFKAKSMPHDELNLAVKTSVRDICFYPVEPQLVSCITKEGFALMYDQRAQRRPVAKFIEPKACYTSMATCYRERQCVVGTTKGYIQLLDLRMPAKCIRTFKSFTGGVTSIVCDSLLPVVASTSLDRYFRIHNLETKELIHKEYMKQSLTKLIIKPCIKEEPENEETNIAEDIDEEYETLFDKMEKIGDETLRKKRKNDSGQKMKKKKKLLI